MKKRIVCLYHAECLDGFAAMLGVYTYALLNNYEFVREAVYYGYPIVELKTELKPTDTVFIVDFSFPIDCIRYLSTIVESVKIFDHHKGAFGIFEQIAEYHALDQLKNIDFEFDLNRSGAKITWDELHTHTPLWVEHVSDHDLWLNKRTFTKAVVAVLMTYGFDDITPEWKALFRFDSDADLFKLYDSGAALVRAREQMVRGICYYNNQTHISEFLGKLVALIECPRFYVSDVGDLATKENYLANHVGFINLDTDVAICYHAQGDKYKYSLRSKKDTVDVSLYAVLFGGGGHVNAASFTLPMDGKSASSALYEAEKYYIKKNKGTWWVRALKRIGLFSN